MSGTTSSSSPNFRIDVIVSSLRELQQEKERLQQLCSEESARCRSLELKLDACQAKYFQSKERNLKMLETVNAAKQKVLQTQIQANRLKELNDGKRAKIEELHKEINEEMKKEQTELGAFEEKLSELTNQFRNARNYYAEENVQREIEHWREQSEKARNEASRVDCNLQELTAAFKQLEMENKHAKDEIDSKLEFGLTHEELKSTLKVVEKINQETKEKLHLSVKQLERDLIRLERAKQERINKNFSKPSPQSQEQSKQKQFGSLVVHHTATEHSSSKGLPTPTEQSSLVLSVNANSNADEDREQSRQNHGNKYPRLNSHNVGSSPVEDRAEQGTDVQLAQGGKKTSFQGRSFFISLPVTPNHV
ncbi:structural maintenance of chromosomes protein 1A-like isoform X2 [Acropora millepora]|uniref:structural maintenance of chromosomes protein 1A-like isoform X2 n=1 Tax=Acropora millepora TaxID=45264 RepID=UPI001CF31527|nr:structural maintenance of chromosomes protein 1A-like isoform X2 [Acropora millepora]